MKHSFETCHCDCHEAVFENKEQLNQFIQETLAQFFAEQPHANLSSDT